MSMDAAQRESVVDSAWIEQVSGEYAAIRWLLHDRSQQVDQKVSLCSAVSCQILCITVKHACHVCVTMNVVQVLAGQMCQKLEDKALFWCHAQGGCEPAGQKTLLGLCKLGLLDYNWQGLHCCHSQNCNHTIVDICSNCNFYLGQMSAKAGLYLCMSKRW